MPRFACSAMDGFALRSADVATATADHPVRLALNPPLPAGGAAVPLGQKAATPISTGAPIPVGADTVLVRERADVVGGQLVLHGPVGPSINIRARGEDIAVGAALGCAGDRLDAERIGSIAAAGITELFVRKRPRLAYFSTGDELAAAMVPAESVIADANRPMIAALAEEAGLKLLDLGHARDSASEIEAMILAGEGKADMLISSGGVSGGAYDLVRTSIEARHGEILFHGLEMRPGKPLLFARLPCGTLFFGLPGNPVAALVGFRFFVLEAVRAALGLPPEQGQEIPFENATGPTRFLKVCTPSKDGLAGPDGSALDQRSHILSSAVAADGWLRSDGGTNAAVFYPKRCGRLT